jgi:hypothetical protein
MRKKYRFIGDNNHQIGEDEDIRGTVICRGQK